MTTFARAVSGLFGVFAFIFGLYVPVLFFANTLRASPSGGMAKAILVALILLLPCSYVAYGSIRFAVTRIRKGQPARN
jgi:hypothetical protein